MRNEDTFFNLQTGKRMTAYLNGKFQRHFHHVEYTQHDSESYLHEAAKQVFEDTYNQCLERSIPYEIEFRKANICQQHLSMTGIVCELDDVLESYDLTQRFKEIKVEKHFDELRPDIQLISVENGNVKDVIFIEIVVTHKSTDHKINKGKRIIEVTISCEDDILQLRRRKLSVAEDKVVFHNFRKTKQIVNYCSSNDKGCRTLVNSFVLYKNGAYEFLCDALENVISHVASEETRIANVDYTAFRAYNINATENEKQNWYLEEAINRGWNIKDCRYCRYQGDRKSRGVVTGLFCKFLRSDIDFNSAWDCKYFRLKKDV
jgi:hypothetical protein